MPYDTYLIQCTGVYRFAQCKKHLNIQSSFGSLSRLPPVLCCARRNTEIPVSALRFVGICLLACLRMCFDS